MNADVAVNPSSNVPPQRPRSDLSTSNPSGSVGHAGNPEACTHDMLQTLTKEQLKELIKTHNLSASGNRRTKEGNAQSRITDSTVLMLLIRFGAGYPPSPNKPTAFKATR
jgi:hypothetical protein